MKLVIAIISDEDSEEVMDSLNSEGFSVTKLCSTGGFLRAGNTTVLVGVSSDKVEKVISIIRNKCKSRTQIITNPSIPGGVTEFSLAYPTEVAIGGATVFVVDIERFEKI